MAVKYSALNHPFRQAFVVRAVSFLIVAGIVALFTSLILLSDPLITINKNSSSISSTGSNSFQNVDYDLQFTLTLNGNLSNVVNQTQFANQLQNEFVNATEALINQTFVTALSSGSIIAQIVVQQSSGEKASTGDLVSEFFNLIPLLNRTRPFFLQYPIKPISSLVASPATPFSVCGTPGYSNLCPTPSVSSSSSTGPVIFVPNSVPPYGSCFNSSQCYVNATCWNNQCFPSGFDVLFVAGQSNSVGLGLPQNATLDIGDPRIQQVNLCNATNPAFIIPSGPFMHSIGCSSLTIGYALSAAKTILPFIPTNRQILVVNAAIGGTGFSSGDWNPGNPRFNTAVFLAQINKAQYQLDGNSTNRFLPVMLWQQGENDANTLTTQQYQSDFIQMFNGFQQEISSFSTYVALGGLTLVAYPSSVAIQVAIQTMPGVLNISLFVNSSGLTTNVGDTLHFNAVSQRLFGQRFGVAVISIMNQGIQMPFVAQSIVCPVGYKGVNCSILDTYCTTNTCFNPFLSTWNTAIASSSGSNQIQLPLLNSGIYNFLVLWGDGSNSTVSAWNQFTHTYASSGVYNLNITGILRGFSFNGFGDKNKIISISQFGVLAFNGEQGNFFGAMNLVIPAVDVLNINSLTGLYLTFAGCSSITSIASINNWNTSKIQYMIQTFSEAILFNSPIGNWDTSQVTNMDFMFQNAASFNQPIGKWNTQSVTSMSNMFNMLGSGSAFNQNLTNWSTSKVTNMANMFEGATAFNGIIGTWDTSSVTNMNLMLFNTFSFNQLIGDWNTYKVTDMGQMLQGATSFNQNLTNWNTGSVVNMWSMFQSASAFNGNIITWNTAQVTNTAQMFQGATSFNQNLNNWNTGSVTNMLSMFQSASSFNGNISTWNTAQVTNMELMFQSATVFNQNLSNWNTSSVANMFSMFQSASAFNGNISTWNTSQVTNMGQMFQGATAFNQPIGQWNTSQVTNMAQMFQGATAFNQPIGRWNTGSVTSMALMFNGDILFNQPIGTWNVSSVTTMNQMMQNNHAFNQDLSGWNTANVKDMTNLFVSAIVFNGNVSNWNTQSVTLMGSLFYNCQAFNQPLNNWNTSSATTMVAMFQSAIIFNQPIGQWNTQSVTSMVSMFQSASAFNQNLTNWNIGSVTNMLSMFQSASAFNGNISTWNTSQVTNMAQMFNAASSFNQPLATWNTGNVKDMTGMFQNTGSNGFNQPIGTWNTGSVTSMQLTFQSAYAFNQQLSNWNTASVTTMASMFLSAIAFNQAIGPWNTSRVTDMSNMLNNAQVFNQDISTWDVRKVTTMFQMVTSANAFNNANINLLLIAWAAYNQTLQNGVILSSFTNHYSCLPNLAQYAYWNLTAPRSQGGDGWTITATCA